MDTSCCPLTESFAEPRDCIGQWQKVGGCSAKCGEGKQKYTYKVIQPAVNGGKKCSHNDCDVKFVTCDSGVACPRMCMSRVSHHCPLPACL